MRGRVAYRFASASHREKFLATPERYEPAYGGWCAYAMLEGDKVSVDPKSFIVKADQVTEANTADAMWNKIGED